MDHPMSLDNFDNVLKTTRSVRRKLNFDRAISLHTIEECIDIATQAPIGLSGENWRFIVVTDAALKCQLARIYCEAVETLVTERNIELKATQRALMDRLHEMPCIILVCAIGLPGNSVAQQTAFYGSILPAAWSLMLALRARNIGTTWTSLLSSKQTEVAKVLDIPPDVTQTIMLPMAYTKDAVMKVADRLAARRVMYMNQWGN